MKKIFLKTVTILSVLTLIFSGSFYSLAVEKTGADPFVCSLKSNKYTYTGKAIKPAVVVKDSKGTLLQSTDYKLSYKSNTNPGIATVTVMVNDGSFSKALSFYVLPKKQPKPTVFSNKQKEFTVTVSEDLKATGYQIRYSTSKTFKGAKSKLLANSASRSTKFTKLKNDTTYYVSVRAYKTVSKKNIYGVWSPAVSVFVTSKAPKSTVPEAMLESYILDAIEYTGYKVKAQRKTGTLLEDCGSGPRTPMKFRSGITYNPVPLGLETVASKTTVSKKAPNLSKFRKYGMCCSSFVTYYFLNYLPNVAGVDTTYIRKVMDKCGERPNYAESWYETATTLVKQGKAIVVDKVGKNQSFPSAHPEKLKIGDLITFRVAGEGRRCGHVAVYAGTNNGLHFVAHVGSNEGPVFQTLERFQNVVNRPDGCAYSTVFRFTGLPTSKYDYKVKSSKAKVKYTGKAQKPQIIVKDATGKTISNKYYTIYYSNNVKVGTATARVIFKGKYKGVKKATFKIVK